jgi:hypothetical protein
MKSLWLLLVGFAFLVAGCGGQDPSEATQETAQALTQTVVENVAPGYVVQPGWTHMSLVESAGPNPPSTPALTETTCLDNQSTTHGVYNTSGKTATMFLTTADWNALESTINSATMSQFPQFTVKYDDTTCSVTTHLCTVTSFTYALESF